MRLGPELSDYGGKRYNFMNMNVNPLIKSTFALAGILFFLGWLLIPRLRGRLRQVFILAGVIAALPTALYLLFYLHDFGEPIFYYQFRALPYTEMLSAGTALLAGQLFRLRLGANPHRIINFRVLYPILVLLLLPVPFIKPAVMPLNYNRIWNRWRDGVCMQTTTATCGPCSAATLLRHFGMRATEKEIARASYSYAFGTENWYLARYLRKRGLKVNYVKTAPSPARIPYPSIAGVRGLGYGHFIVVLDKTPKGYVIADSLAGEAVLSEKTIFKSYTFTGFFMRVEK